MKIQTLSIVAGTTACDTNCPFCVSKMTPKNGVQSNVDYTNFNTACKFASRCGVTTAMITGKGEPTLYPHQITMYLKMLNDHQFPFIELQTNGINLYLDSAYKEYLIQWKRFGLTTISLSCVHYEDKQNREIYGEKYPPLRELITDLQKMGFSVRLGCIMINGWINSFADVHAFVQFAKTLDKQVQLTFRPVTLPIREKGYEKVYNWVADHQVGEMYLKAIDTLFEDTSDIVPLLDLVHGATVYDYQGQNVCMTNCLTRSTNKDEVRQLIYFPDGRLRYDWEYEGAILL